MIKLPWCAVFLSSLLPGAGQIYAEAQRKGIVFLTLHVFFLCSGVIGIIRFIYSDAAQDSIRMAALGFVSLGLVFIIGVWSLFDAYWTTRRLNEIHAAGPMEKPAKNPWFAVFLSRVFPGVGQFYNGNIVKGIGFLILFAALIMLEDVHSAFSLLFIPFTLFIMKDAFESAERRNGSLQQFFLLGNKLAKLLVLLMVTIAAIPAGAIIKSVFVESFKIPSGAMMPTLLVGDHFLVKKHIEKDALRRGDIIVFRYPHDRSKNFVKRVIALGGETIEARDKAIYVNGIPQEEPYTRHSDAEYSQRSFGPIRIPEGTYFVLGDNRDNSMDSRLWGPVPSDDVLGKALKIYWSWDAAAVTVRWERIGLKLY